MMHDDRTLKVDTAWFENGLIEQSMFDGSRLIMRQMMNTSEAHIRKALIALGWTPPATLKRMEGVTAEIIDAAQESVHLLPRLRLRDIRDQIPLRNDGMLVVCGNDADERQRIARALFGRLFIEGAML
jgi:hypothetical protein